MKHVAKPSIIDMDFSSKKSGKEIESKGILFAVEKNFWLAEQFNN